MSASEKDAVANDALKKESLLQDAPTKNTPTNKGQQNSSKQKSLTHTLYITILTFSVCLVLVFALAAVFLMYKNYEADAADILAQNTQELATRLESQNKSEQLKTLASQANVNVRYTFIDEDGVVLYDNWENVSSMPNHKTRPEIEEAYVSSRVVVQERYSSTLEKEVLYAAKSLEDGNVLRLAETRHTLVQFLQSISLPLICLLVLVCLFAFALSRLLSKKVVTPLDSLDFSKPLKNSAYEEMNPLLERIDAQQNLLKEQNQRLEDANSMRREFTSNVSHEMKTPLTVISGYAELMKNNMVKKEDQQRFSELIYDEAKNMQSLIDDVLIISKLEESEDEVYANEVVDVLEVAKEQAARLESFAQENDVDVNVWGTQAKIMGSRTQLAQMLHNLIENGIRYNKKGGSVKVTCEEKTDTHQVVLSVADNGVGIALEFQEKIFERFYRVDASRSKETGGTGLGLAIVKHAAQRLGASIYVDSTEGEGTTFTIIFPAAF